MSVKRRTTATAIRNSSGDELSGDDIIAHVNATTVLQGSGNPNGVVTGKLGQHYIDTDANVIYVNTLDDSTSWDVVG